jgi:hypothetical protein
LVFQVEQEEEEVVVVVAVCQQLVVLEVVEVEVNLVDCVQDSGQNGHSLLANIGFQMIPLVSNK